MAKIFLDENDNFTLSSEATVFGTGGVESVIIEATAENIILDQNIDRVDFFGRISDFTFRQAGNQMEVYDKTTQLIVKIPLQPDINGTEMVFSDGSVSSLITAGVMRLGGTAVTSTSQTALPVTINSAVVSQSTTSLEPSIINHSYTNSSLGALSSMNSEGVSSLASGTYWSSNLSTLTYSFNETIPLSYYEEEDDSLTNGFTPLNDEQREAVRSMIEQIGALIGIDFEEIEVGGDIRFNIIEMEDENVVAFAFYPEEGVGGDVFLSSEYNDETTLFDYNLEQGREGWSTIVHELGHAFGLKHPFEEEIQLPTEQDNTAHTIMSYTNVNNYQVDFALQNDGSIQAEYISVLSQLYSLYDVSVLQAIYGANESTNRDDNTYTMSFDEFKFQTIWDAGGNDTFDFSANRGDTTLNLNGGTLNSVDEYSLDEIVNYYQNEVDTSHYNSWIEDVVSELYHENSLYSGKNNLGIANGVIIENIKTGSGDDVITDSAVDNRISTSSGNDKIYVGNGGYDYVDGGEGNNDILYIDLSKNDVTVEVYNENYLMYSQNYSVEFENIELIAFNNGIMYEIDALIA